MNGTRGGNPSRRLKVTGKGMRAVRESRDILLDFFQGAELVTGQP